MRKINFPIAEFSYGKETFIMYFTSYKMYVSHYISLIAEISL